MDCSRHFGHASNSQPSLNGSGARRTVVPSPRQPHLRLSQASFVSFMPKEDHKATGANCVAAAWGPLEPSRKSSRRNPCRAPVVDSHRHCCRRGNIAILPTPTCAKRNRWNSLSLACCSRCQCSRLLGSVALPFARQDCSVLVESGKDGITNRRCKLRGCHLCQFLFLFGSLCAICSRGDACSKRRNCPRCVSGMPTLLGPLR